MGKLITRYAAWLVETSGPREISTIFAILAFPTFAFGLALLTGLPAFHALRERAPLQGIFQWQAKDGQMVSTPIQPLASIDAVIIVMSAPLLLSGVAFCLGWLNRFSD